VPDGSRHEWLAGFDAMDLIVTMDDATSVMVHTLPDRLVKELALAGDHDGGGGQRLYPHGSLRRCGCVLKERC